MKQFTSAIALAVICLTPAVTNAQSVDFRNAIRGAESVVTKATFTLSEPNPAVDVRMGRRFARSSNEVSSNAFVVSDNLLVAFAGRPAESVVLENPGGEITDGEIVCMDYVTGLAVIKVEDGFGDSLVISSADLEVGLPIVSVSMPGGVLTANSGMVSTKPTPVSVVGLVPKVEFIGETPTAGAPVLDSEGIVVGVMIPSERDMICVPAPAVLRLVETAMSDKPQDLKRGLVGLQFEDEGPLVMEVAEDSAAAEAGLKAGDLVVSVDRTETATAADVVAAVASARAGDSIDVSVDRGGEVVAIPVELREHPVQIAATEPALGSQWQRGFELKDGRLVPMDIRPGQGFPAIPDRLLRVPMELNQIGPMGGLQIERSNVERTLQELQRQMEQLNERFDPDN
ncbi:MAG: S1C family serine protease [Planctomycetota bacterium]